MNKFDRWLLSIIAVAVILMFWFFVIIFAIAGQTGITIGFGFLSLLISILLRPVVTQDIHQYRVQSDLPTEKKEASGNGKNKETSQTR